MTSPSSLISFLRDPKIIIYIELLYLGLIVEKCAFVESLISVTGKKTKILPDIRLFSKVFHCQHFLNKERNPESKTILEMLVQYKCSLKKMSNFVLRFFWNLEFKNLMASMEKAMAPHSSALAWRIPWMEEPERLQSMGSLRVGHD